MKSKSSILLIICLITENILFILFYQAQSLFIKFDAERRIKLESELDTLIFSKPTFESLLINSKELVIDGSFFDIFSVTHHENKVIVTGLWDIKEALLKKQIELKVDSDVASEVLSLFPVILTPFVLIQPTELKYFFSGAKRKEIITLINFKIIHFLSSLLKPPININ